MGADDPVLLYTGPLQFAVGDRVGQLEGLVELRWLPTPSVRYIAQTEDVGLGWDLTDAASDERPTITLPPGVGVPTVDAEVAHRVGSRNAAYSTSGVLGRVTWGEGRALASVSFRVMNCPVDSGAISLDGLGWSITLEPEPGAPTRESLNETGGYGFTHRINARRSDNAEFRWAEVEHLYTAMRWLLSFGRGAQVGVALPVGCSGDGTEVSGEWSMWDAAAGASATSWQLRRTSALPRLSSKLLSLSADDEWSTTLYRAIAYYLEANDPDPVDKALIMAQAALELLGWWVLVRTEGWLAPTARLPAAGRLRLLLKWAGIPTDVPPALAGTLDARPREVVDGPDTVTWARNSVVHPKPGPLKILPVLADAWMLAMWYLELVLLRILGYEGPYMSRVEAPRRMTESETPWSV